MHEYVDGPTLLSVFKNIEGTGYRFPEASIWKFGATFLEIIRQMLFPQIFDGGRSEAMSHNDIYPRNILVSNIFGEEDASRFHLIDFGIATRGNENPRKMNDLICISDILFSLMLGRNIGAAARFQVHCGRTCQDWPYSTDLFMRVSQVYEAARSVTFKAPLKRDWFDAMIAAFRHNTRKSVEAAKKTGRETRIYIERPLTNFEPWGVGMNDIERPIDTILKYETRCFPCQKAWIDSESLEIVRVEDEIIWA